MAGIPLIERLVAKALIARWCRAHPPERTLELCGRQRDELASLIERAGSQATTRVQIKRLRGLESSSTNWSLAMVADHLSRTNRDMAEVLACLVREEPSATEVVIANYKPDPDAKPEPALMALDESLTQLGESLMNFVAIRSSSATHAHPWFGPMGAVRWACFPSFHQHLHLQQARMIAEGLAGPA